MFVQDTTDDNDKKKRGLLRTWWCERSAQTAVIAIAAAAFTKVQRKAEKGRRVAEASFLLSPLVGRFANVERRRPLY